jgi:hypothetical protein
MYFWNVDGLKRQLCEQGLSEYHCFLYILMYVAIAAAWPELIPYLPNESRNGWDDVSSLLTVVIAIAGTIYVYNANGGAKGRDFAARFFSISLVVTIRFIALMCILLVPLKLIVSLPLGSSDDPTSLVEVLLFFGLEVWLYGLIGKHVQSVAISAKVRDCVAHAS